MTIITKRLFILSADDDEEDRMLFEEALQSVGAQHLLFAVYNGDRLINFLNDAYRKGEPLPHVIFLDLNMPVKNGKETLKILKDPDSLFRHIPIILLTTSAAPGDIEECYRLGANLFIVKPLSFNGLAAILKDLLAVFTGMVRLPSVVPAPEGE